VLKNSFGDQWLSFDPKDPGGKITSSALSDTIESNSDKVAFSSHCIVPPLPEGEFTVFPIVVLRDPISRVMSAYLFEWKKQLALEKPKGTLTEYIQNKFSSPRANAIEDFQTIRLSVSEYDRGTPRKSKHDEEILADAKQFIAELPVFCLVEDFQRSLMMLEDYLSPTFPDMNFDIQAKNTTQDTSIPLHERHEKIKTLIGTDTYDELVRRNQLDIKLYAFAQGRFMEMYKQSKIASDEFYPKALPLAM